MAVEDMAQAGVAEILGRMSTRPNILILFTDDQRHDTIGALGNERIRTPHMDTLVDRGTAFTRCHIMGGSCGAVCMPSRAMLHTGRHIWQLDDRGQSIPEDHVLMGEHFQAHGYTAFGTGKWHNGSDAYARSFDKGGAVFFGGMADHWRVPWHRFDPTGGYGPETRGGGNGCHSTTVCTEEAVQFIRRHDLDQPFLCYVSYLAPHDPRSMPEEFLHDYLRDLPELPDNFAPEHPFDYGERLIRDELLADLPRRPDQIRRHLAEYFGMISHLDYALGRLMAVLAEQGQLDNTIVVLAGDNGLSLGQHGLMGKQSLYDHSLRVPFVIAGPGIPSGARRDQLCYLHDLFPTLCELSGLPIPDTVLSRSLAAAITGNAAHRELLHVAYRGLIRGVTDGRYKYIEYAACGQHLRQLFDLQDDPLEMNDLSRDTSQTDRLTGYAEALEAWRDQLGDRHECFGVPFWQLARPA